MWPARIVRLLRTSAFATLRRVGEFSILIGIVIRIAFWIGRPAPRKTVFEHIALTSARIEPMQMTYASTLYGRNWHTEQPPLVLRVHGCGDSWCLAEISAGDHVNTRDSLVLARSDLRVQASHLDVFGVTGIMWGGDSLRTTYEDEINGTTPRVRQFAIARLPGALPDAGVLDLLLAAVPAPKPPGGLFALQAILPHKPGKAPVREKAEGESREIMRLLAEDTIVVESKPAPPRTLLTVHYADRIEYLTVMDSTHRIIRREVQFRDAVAGVRVDSLVDAP
jgi:hypothetical protein